MSEYESIKARRERERKEKAERLKVAQNKRLVSKLEEPIRDRIRRERAERTAESQGKPAPKRNPEQDLRDFAAEILRKKLPPPAPGEAQPIKRQHVELPGAANIPPAPDKRQKREVFPGGKDLNLVINILFVNNDGNVYELEGHPDRTLYFRNGLFVGNVNPDVGDPPAGLITEYSTHLSIAP